MNPMFTIQCLTHCRSPISSYCITVSNWHVIGTQVLQNKVLLWQVPSSVCIRQHFGNRTGQLSEFLKSSYPEVSRNGECNQSPGNLGGMQER